MLSTFETDRLLFRPFEREDLPVLSRLYAEPEVMQYVAPVRDAAKTEEHMNKHLRDRRTHGFGLLATIQKSDGVFVGRCGLDPYFVDGHLQGALAWMFFPEYWGMGYATEFGRRMLKVGHGELALQRIVAHARIENDASIKVMRKIGMAHVTQIENEVEYESIRGA